MPKQENYSEKINRLVDKYEKKEKELDDVLLNPYLKSDFVDIFKSITN